MKKTPRKIIPAIILVAMLMASVFTINTVSAAQEGVITASKVQAEVGDENVDIDIFISENPGIMGMTLTVTFDENVLELVNVRDAGKLGAQSHKHEKESPYTLAWSDDTATSNNTSNGVVATLTFKVKKNAVKGCTYSIGLSYDYDNYDIYDTNMYPVKFSLKNGEIVIGNHLDYQIGDTDMNGRITINDVTEIQRQLAEITYFSDEQYLLADTDGNGTVNIADATHLQKYLAEFDGIVLG